MHAQHTYIPTYLTYLSAAYRSNQVHIFNKNCKLSVSSDDGDITE